MVPKCSGCGGNNPLMVTLYDYVWEAIGSPGGILCVPCIETRLGKSITLADFKPSAQTDLIRLGASLVTEGVPRPGFYSDKTDPNAWNVAEYQQRMADMEKTCAESVLAGVLTEMENTAALQDEFAGPAYTQHTETERKAFEWGGKLLRLVANKVRTMNGIPFKNYRQDPCKLPELLKDHYYLDNTLEFLFWIATSELTNRPNFREGEVTREKAEAVAGLIEDDKDPYPDRFARYYTLAKGSQNEVLWEALVTIAGELALHGPEVDDARYEMMRALGYKDDQAKIEAERYTKGNAAPVTETAAE